MCVLGMFFAGKGIEYPVKRIAIGKIAARTLPFILVAVILALTFFLPQTGTETPQKRIIRIWNVDTFEGGKGSRSSFLKTVARDVQKRDKNVYYLVTSYTAEGATEAYRNGDCPDLLSFGVGLGEFAERSLSLNERFAGGMFGGEPIAYPWCRGSYFLFSLTDNFGEEGKTAISCGGQNLACLAAMEEGIVGTEAESVAAYTGFLKGEYRYLLGTQRDVCRFAARGVEVYQKPLTAYCDLYQYISILSAEHMEDCRVFLNRLLSFGQERLSEIGMYALADSDPPNAQRTISVFSSRDALERLRTAVKEGETKIIEKNLKSI